MLSGTQKTNYRSIECEHFDGVLSRFIVGNQCARLSNVSIISIVGEIKLLLFDCVSVFSLKMISRNLQYFSH